MSDRVPRLNAALQGRYHIEGELEVTALFDGSESYALYDVSPDDERFIWLRSVEKGRDPELILVDNWTADLPGPAAAGKGGIARSDASGLAASGRRAG